MFGSNSKWFPLLIKRWAYYSLYRSIWTITLVYFSSKSTEKGDFKEKSLWTSKKALSGRNHWTALRDTDLLSMSEQFIPPFIAGKNSVLITSSNCWSWISMFGIILLKHISLCLNHLIHFYAENCCSKIPLLLRDHCIDIVLFALISFDFALICFDAVIRFAFY